MIWLIIWNIINSLAIIYLLIRNNNTKIIHERTVSYEIHPDLIRYG